MIKDKSLLRHILKTISYRIFGTSITFLAVFIMTGSLKVSGAVGFGELVFKPILYFIHERIWYKYIKMKK
jgi:uncharacterized membrane protein